MDLEQRLSLMPSDIALAGWSLTPPQKAMLAI
jgi:hypothetical protein